MIYARLEATARFQHGLVTRAQAEAAGVSRPTWYRMLSSRRLIEVRPGIARLPGAGPTASQSILAAVLWRGGGAIASHRSAARVWGAPVVGDDPVDVIVGRQDGHSDQRGVRLHHPRDRDDLRATLWCRIPVTNPLRTLLDLGAVDPASVPVALKAFIQAGLVRPSAIDAVVARHSRRGRHGTVALRRALADWQFDSAPPDSELEIVMRRLGTAYSLPPMTFHAVVEGFEVDFLVDDTSVILECDGWVWHGRDRDQFEFDRVRNAVLSEAGFVVLHFTWRTLIRDPAWVAERIRQNVLRWAPHLHAARSGGSQAHHRDDRPPDRWASGDAI